MALLAKKVSKIFPSNRRNSVEGSEDPLVTRQKGKGFFRRVSTESNTSKNRASLTNEEAAAVAAAMATAAILEDNDAADNTIKSGGRRSITAPSLSSPRMSLKRVFKRSSKPTLKRQLQLREQQQQQPEEETPNGEKPNSSTPTEEQRQEQHQAQDAPDCHDADGDSTLETSPTPVSREKKDPALLLSVPDLPELSLPNNETAKGGDNAPDKESEALAAAVTPKQLLPRPLKFVAKTPDSASSCCGKEVGEDREARRNASTPPVKHVEVRLTDQPFALAPLLPDLGGRITDRPPPRAGEWDDATLESNTLHEEEEDETLRSDADCLDVGTATTTTDYEAVAKMKPLIERAARMALLKESGDSSRSSPAATGRHSFAARSSEISVPETLPEAFLRGSARTPEQRLRQRYHRYNSCYQTHQSARTTRHGLRDSRRALLASLDSTAPPATGVPTNIVAAPPLAPRVSPLQRRHSHQPQRHVVPTHPSQQQRIVKWHVVQSSQPAGQPA